MMDDQKPTPRDIGIAIGLGVVFMIIALIPQIATQETPSIVIILKYGLAKGTTILTNFELSNPIVYALFIGGSAAVYQELLKYFAVGTQKRNLTLWIGLGFALVDIAVLLVGTIPSILTKFSVLLLSLASLNAFSSLLFHPGTAGILKYGRAIHRGVYFLLLTILLHGIEDGGLVFTDIFVINNPGTYLKAIAIFWLITITISVVSFILGFRYLKKISLIPKTSQS